MKTDQVAAGALRSDAAATAVWAHECRRALPGFERAVSGWTPSQAASMEAATLLQDGRDQEAAELLLAGPQRSFRDLFNLATAHVRLGRQRDARTFFLAARELDAKRFEELRVKAMSRHATFVSRLPGTRQDQLLRGGVARMLRDHGFRVTLLHLGCDDQADEEPEAETAQGVLPVAGLRQLARRLPTCPPSVTLVGCWLDYLPVLAAVRGPVIGLSTEAPALEDDAEHDDRFREFRYRAHRLPLRLLTGQRHVQRTHTEVFGRRSLLLPMVPGEDLRRYVDGNPAVVVCSDLPTLAEPGC